LHILNEQIKLIFLDQNIEKIKIFYDKKFDQKQYEKSVDLKIFFYEKLKKCVELMKLNYELDFNDNYFYFVNVLKEK
jgi:heme oxygenase